MFKKENGSNGAKIGIVFHCQDTEEDNALSEDMFDEGADEDGEEGATAVRFAVTVSKGGQTVVMQCRAVEDTLDVEGVAVRDGDAESALIALAGGEQLNSALYQVSLNVHFCCCSICYGSSLTYFTEIDKHRDRNSLNLPKSFRRHSIHM